MQNVNTLINRPVRTGTAAAGGLLAFVAGALLAVTQGGVIELDPGHAVLLGTCTTSSQSR